MPIIEVKNIGKKYNITHRQGGYLTLRDVLTNVFKNPFRFLKQKAKAAAGLIKNEEFWALKDVSFNVEKGEVIGIIGRNGAGKSTLLKILSQITPPTTGEIRINGRVGSLLEVGTGFHQELSGRENIFLNGAILGMKRNDIVKKFDEIVEFAGIEKFLDTPVKYYSSGMYVRLAFSVAAHMEPDVLIIDEVLAVGDADFQKKCLGKMDEITKKEGRTILFVSHNMEAIQGLCKRCVLLENGEIIKEGKTSEVINFYLNRGGQNAIREYLMDKNKTVQISKISILNKNLEPSAALPISEDFYIKVDYEFFKPEKNLLFSIVFYSGEELLLYTSESDKKGATNDYEIGQYSTTIKIPAFVFNIGNFHFDAIVHSTSAIFDHKNRVNFGILNINNPKSRFQPNYELGKVGCLLDYKSVKIN
jgi:lipopolysaccharide transport system ATP-binding protein